MSVERLSCKNLINTEESYILYVAMKSKIPVLQECEDLQEILKYLNQDSGIYRTNFSIAECIESINGSVQAAILSQVLSDDGLVDIKYYKEKYNFQSRVDCRITEKGKKLLEENSSVCEHLIKHGNRSEASVPLRVKKVAHGFNLRESIIKEEPFSYWFVFRSQLIHEFYFVIKRSLPGEDKLKLQLEYCPGSDSNNLPVTTIGTPENLPNHFNKWVDLVKEHEKVLDPSMARRSSAGDYSEDEIAERLMKILSQGFDKDELNEPFSPDQQDQLKQFTSYLLDQVNTERAGLPVEDDKLLNDAVREVEDLTSNLETTSRGEAIKKIWKLISTGATRFGKSWVIPIFKVWIGKATYPYAEEKAKTLQLFAQDHGSELLLMLKSYFPG